jgi:hypothetical protein
MVIGYHLIMTGYGWWLPNDPRGSTSQYVVSDLIAELGELRYGRKRVEPVGSEIREFYDEAARVLKHDLLEFDERARIIIARAFDECVKKNGYTCYACAILRDHIHALIRKHKHLAEDMIVSLQQLSAEALREAGLRPSDHPVWAQGDWKVFLDSPDDIRRTIRYINLNSPKHRLPEQRWPFVIEYDNWPLHHKRHG